MAVSGQTETKLNDQTLPFSFNKPHQIAVFDFDYDYKNDIAYAGKSGFKLYKQTDNGVFEDVSEKTGICWPAKCPAYGVSILTTKATSIYLSATKTVRAF